MVIFALIFWMFLLVNKQKYTDKVLRENWMELPESVKNKFSQLTRYEQYAFLAFFVIALFDFVMMIRAVGVE